MICPCHRVVAMVKWKKYIWGSMPSTGKVLDSFFLFLFLLSLSPSTAARPQQRSSGHSSASQTNPHLQLLALPHRLLFLMSNSNLWLWHNSSSLKEGTLCSLAGPFLRTWRGLLNISHIGIFLCARHGNLWGAQLALPLDAKWEPRRVVCGVLKRHPN